ncbi:unnamed protein product [Chrysodeixis includens]|uniref:Filaggrin-2-like n=1 Tax=Chrysodeixis includens TaxID=689277 RepID=A0A9P0FWC7_CHRIL|nr:unnamed protein product [Chrysodeixis includens]
MLVLTFVVIIIVDSIGDSMARNVAALLLLLAYGSCMEMRETVERMVMVRTTGSDLQPAATGYIYKKESDGPASVIKMGESEVIEHFSKLHGKPEAYKAPLPAAAGPFYAAEKDEHKAASETTEEEVKPVVEKTDEHDDDRIDGIATEDYDKIFEEYAKRYGSGYKNDFTDYLHGVGHYDHGVHHGFGPGNAYDAGSYQGYGAKGDKGDNKLGTKNYYEKGEAGDYNTEKHEGYSVSKEHGHKGQYDDSDDEGKHYYAGFKGIGPGHHAGHTAAGAADGYHKLYKDNDFFDGGSFKDGNSKYAGGHADYGSGARGYKVHKSGHHDADFGKGETVDKDSGEQDEQRSAEDSAAPQQDKGKFGIASHAYAGKGYGIKIKH